MKFPRIRFTVRGLMAAGAVTALLLVGSAAAVRYLGPGNGTCHGSYGHLGDDRRWHEVRANVTTVRDGMILGD